MGCSSQDTRKSAERLLPRQSFLASPRHEGRPFHFPACHAQEGLTYSPALSSIHFPEIVWLMSQSARTSGRCAPGHKQFFISDLEWPAARPLGSPRAGQAAKAKELMTPVLLQQFRTFYAQDRPLGVVLWATVSDEVAARLTEGTTKLRPQDWKSGDKLWVMPEACFQHDEVIAACPGPRHASDEKTSNGSLFDPA